MAALVLLCFVSCLYITASLDTSTPLQTRFLDLLSQQELMYYFDANSSDGVPEFGVIWVDCPSEKERCRLHAMGDSYEFVPRDSDYSLWCPATVEKPLNSTLSVVRVGESVCCKELEVLKPRQTRAFLSLCQGNLQGLISSKGRRLYIQPLLQKHSHLIKDLGPTSGHAHLVFHREMPGVIIPELPQMETRLPRSALTSEVNHLELLVVVGPDVQQVHRQDTEKYILTNLNIASELLRDATLGANLRVHLIRMIILTEPEPEIQMSANISSSLRSICEWGRKINPANDTDPLHADLLLYITRFDLLLPNGNKLVRGVTQLGGICSSEWSCIITEDTGFDLGITIAHEIGHSFNVSHDGTDNSCSSSGFMMASDGGYNSVDLTWSQCSRARLQNFFRTWNSVGSTGKADCVTDLPLLEGSLQDWKPGLYYGVDDQCRIAFGSSAKACSFRDNDMAVCRVLSCHTVPGDQSTCTRLLVPLLDGTECAPNKWCLKGRCVSPSKWSYSVVHGAWSSWSEFSPCSRTCGGGIIYRKRQCNNPRPVFGGRPCEGQNIEAEICGSQHCGNTQLDFMAEQCSHTDPLPLYTSPSRASHHSWMPSVGYIKGDMQCKFMCLSKGEDFIVSRGSQFVDGTRCEPDHSVTPGSISACLEGRCQVFGCDGVLNSGKVADVCGVCGGDGSTCHLTSLSYHGGESREYITFLTLPVNATQIHVINRKPVFTHLAVLVEDRYVVSGTGSIALNTTHPSPLEDGHMTYHLYLTTDQLPDKEELVIPGPVQEKTHIQVFRKYGKEYGEKTSPNISYHYYTPNSAGQRAPSGKWSAITPECSVSCGSGFQKIAYVCMDENAHEHLEEVFCESTPRPLPLVRVCIQPDCPSSWEQGQFGPCSTSCGGGERFRLVRCLQRQGPVTMEVPSSKCPQNSEPSAMETCNTQPCPARWHASDPGECSAVCGAGEARRNVSCMQFYRGQDSAVDPSLCLEPRPLDVVHCIIDVCPIGWETLDKAQQKHKALPKLMPHSMADHIYVWSPVIGHCSKTCGNGTLQVWYSCVDHQTRFAVPELHCDRSSKPEAHTEACNSIPCPAVWRYIQEPCSMSCGGGVARRVLYCSRESEGMGWEQVVSDSTCRSIPRPLELVVCNSDPCPPRWKVWEVGSCSASCGLGVAARWVTCVQYDKGLEGERPEEKCAPMKKPPTAVPCQVQFCTFRWEVQEWSKCSVECGFGIQSRTVSCVGPTHPNPVSPLLCMHFPKPITVQACHTGECSALQNITDLTTTPQPTVGTTQGHNTGRVHMTRTSLHSSKMNAWDNLKTALHSPRPLGTTPSPTEIPTLPPQTSLCGQLLLQASGTIDLRNVRQMRCIIAIGRPLGEVIKMRIESSTLNCKAKEYLAFYDRLILIRKCEKMAGSEVTSRTNVLLVRQGRLGSGNGVLLTYSSLKNTKRSHHEDCDIQLFGPFGIIENPTKSSSSGSQTCRVFINAPPSRRIKIQALSMFNATSTHSTYVLIRDVDTLKTTMFKGHQLFLWISSGSRAEVEFHGEYQQIKGTFQAEYSFANS